tara:strand:+ start:215 stop:394 length:180 start_codon:yes stop_codon:yes gene_type:complete
MKKLPWDEGNVWSDCIEDVKAVPKLFVLSAHVEVDILLVSITISSELNLINVDILYYFI